MDDRETMDDSEKNVLPFDIASKQPIYRVPRWYHFLVIFLLVFLCIVSIAVLCVVVINSHDSDNHNSEGKAKNMIVMIVDGMGDTYNAALRAYKHGQWEEGQEKNLFDEYFLAKFDPTPATFTSNEDASIPDSASTATAFSTGVFTKAARIAVDLDANPVGTLLEGSKSLGKAVGVVATQRITHATPATYYAHTSYRGFENLIAYQLLMSNVDVALGGGKRHFVNKSNSGKRTDNVDVSQGLFPGHSWTVAYNKSDMDKLTVDDLPAIGLFASSYMNYAIDRNYMAAKDPEWDQPSLLDMSQKAVELLEEKGGENGFFLMVESSLVDYCGHWTDFPCLIREMEAMEEALAYLVDYTNARDDTTVVMMPDHETGGLALGRGININSDDFGRIKSGGVPGTGLADDMFKYETDIQANYIVPKGLNVKSYPYVWKPHEIDGIEMSCKTIAGLAYADPDNILSIVSEKLGYTLTDVEKTLLLASVESSPGVGNGTSGAFHSYWGDNIVIYWAIAEIVNHRVGVTFASHQHSSADVTLAGSGVGVDVFEGKMIKNIDIGQLLADILGIDLTSVTAQLRQEYLAGVFDICISDPIYHDSIVNGKQTESLPDGNLRSGACPGTA